jgi:hypothetical protein
VQLCVGITQYILVCTGFRNARRPIPAPLLDPDSGPDPHDEEYMDARPDKEDMEEAIEHFLSGLEKQEERGFRDLHRLLSELPMPQPAARRSLSVSEAIEAGFLPKQDEGVVDMFTPSELRLYRHAQDHRYAYF